MKANIIAILLLLITQLASSIARANPTITAYCPPASEIHIQAQTGSSWASEKYLGRATLNIHHQSLPLDLSGEGNAITAFTMQAATWTDRTFLCLYDGITADNAPETLVLYNSQLDRFIISRCYFPGGGPECVASDPNACMMTCEIKQR